MSKSKNLVTVTFQMDEEMHYLLRRHALDVGMSMKGMINELIKEELVKSNVINEGDYKQ